MICRPLFVLLFALVLGTAAWAQEVPKPVGPQNPEVSVAALQARVDAITADAGLSTEAKAPLLEVLGRALDSARTAEARQQAQQGYDTLRSTVADRLTQRAAELQAIEARKPGPDRADLKLAELEQGFAAAQATQAEAQKQAAAAESERARRAERRTAIPTLVGEFKAKLDALPTQVPETTGADARLSAARRLALLAERLRLQAESEALTAELQDYDAEIDLLRTEGDLAARRATAAKADAEAWLAVLQPMRAAEAQRAEQAARENALQAAPALKELAQGNTELAGFMATLAKSRERAEREKADRDQERLRLQQDFDEVKKRVELVGSIDAVGTQLRERRKQLADTSRQAQQRRRGKQDRIADAMLKSFEFDERRRRLVEDPETWLQGQLGDQAAQLPPFVIDEARRLREGRRDLLQQLADGYTSLLNTETSVASTERQISELITTYRSYVTERVLGIRSAAPIWQLDWHATGQALAWLGDPQQWRYVGSLSFEALVEDGWPLALLIPTLVLLAMQRTLRRRLVELGDRAARGSNVAYLPTALAAIDTTLLAAPLPLLLWLWSWRLGLHPDCSAFGKAIAVGAQQTAWALMLVLSLRALLLPRGLAEAHFNWQSTTIAQLRRTIPLLLLVVLPFTFLLAALEVPSDDSWLGSVGALLLIGQLGLSLVVFWRVLHPTTGLIGGGVKTRTATLFRFRRLVFLLALGVPTALLTMVVLGYEYTAQQLALRLHLTMAVLFTAVLVHAMILRGLVLERRRLQIRRAQERLQAAKAADAAVEGAEVPPTAEGVDPQSLARQTQALLRGALTIAVVVATFQIWVDFLPALGILRHFELWKGGTEASPTVVTLADVLLSLFILVASLTAARNLPALLELLVLQRLNMQAGERHAVTTLGRYGIVIIGVLWSFNSIGVGWAKVQWLVAAVSVGLGFGLQEIFANFVSGLILLFERPIRVGDIVTVGEVTGRVTRIRIRATTIQDWTRKELIVPNREFVTGHFVNWTLTDSVVRWTLSISAAYGTDTQKALTLLDQVATESRHVLKDPRPEAVFVGFGDSNLNLELRLFVDMNALEYRWMTELHQAIARKFRDAGIEMAFPQRDVNLRLAAPILELLRAKDLESGAR